MNLYLDETVKEAFRNRIILITGGTGSIGSEIVHQLIKCEPKQIRIYSRDESKHFFLEKELEKYKSPIDIRFFIGDIRDKERLNRAFSRVDIVFHAAALKHVPYCEYNPFEAIKTNIYGTQNLIDVAIDHDIEKLIAISTDKAVYPNTVMGITKLMMERMIIASKPYIGVARTKLCVVRFGNVLNSRGSVVPLWIDQIKNGGPVTVTDKKMKRFFMSIPEAVELVFYAGSIMLGEEIFALKMTEKNIYQLARETIKNNSRGKKIKIKIVGSREREKLVEKIYTGEEKELMIDIGKFYVILPNKAVFDKRKSYYKSYSYLIKNDK